MYLSYICVYSHAEKFAEIQSKYTYNFLDTRKRIIERVISILIVRNWRIFHYKPRKNTGKKEKTSKIYKHNFILGIYYIIYSITLTPKEMYPSARRCPKYSNFTTVMTSLSALHPFGFLFPQNGHFSSYLTCIIPLSTAIFRVSVTIILC
jgi:hypothetical protein